MAETFTPKAWSPGQTGGTPITALELNRLEQGIEAIDDRVAAIEGTISDLTPALTFESADEASANTAALAAAISTAAVTGRAVRVVGSGDVYVNPITLSAGVRLIVDSGVVLTNNNPAGGSCVTVAAGGVVEGFGIIDGNRGDSPSSSNSRGVEVTGSRATVRDVTIQQTGGAGVYLSAGADSCAVVNTTILDAGKEGIVANLSGTSTATDYTLISGNRIERSGRQVADELGTEGAGIKAFGDAATHVAGPEGLRIVNNHVSAPADGEVCIELWGFGRHTIISGNHTRGGYMGISVDACRYVTVTGNTCYDHSDLGIEWAGGHWGSCTANTVNGNANTHTGISITNSDVSEAGEAITCLGNIVENLDPSPTAAFGGGPSRCVNVQDMSHVIVGPGNILSPPTSGFSVRIQSLNETYSMTSVKVAGNLMLGGASGVQIYNSTDDAATLDRIVITGNTFEDCVTGVDYSEVANTYVSGNQFLGVTTVANGTELITGDNDWQGNFPREANN